ncbi:MAG: OB-fold nucleic acid binding domain-containing protein [Promethearchaeota archaeon]
MMSESQGFKRFPAVTCWIQHLLQGTFSAKKNALYTIFGLVKRVRIMATIHDKKEILRKEAENELGEGMAMGTHNIVFELEDGTGRIRANSWRVNPEEYDEFQIGDIVDIVGIIQNYQGFISIRPDFIRKVENPNMFLLRDAEIVKRLKAGEVFEIPKAEKLEEVFPRETEVVAEEIDVDTLFEEGGEENEKEEEIEDIRHRLIMIIRKSTEKGIGIHFNELLEIFDLPENELRKHLQDLEIKGVIYQMKKDLFESF